MDRDGRGRGGPAELVAALQPTTLVEDGGEEDAGRRPKSDGDPHRRIRLSRWRRRRGRAVVVKVHRGFLVEDGVAGHRHPGLLEGRFRLALRFDRGRGWRWRGRPWFAIPTEEFDPTVGNGRALPRRPGLGFGGWRPHIGP